MRHKRFRAMASRHDKLLELIRTGQFSSVTLGRKLRVSEQTVYRDIEFLREAGHEISAQRHADGWAYRLSAEPQPASDGREAP